MRERDSTIWLLALFAVSALVHALAWVGLGTLPIVAELFSREDELIEIGMVVEPPAPLPEPEVVPEPEPAPEPEPEPEPVRPRVRAPDPVPQPEQAPPPPPDLPPDQPAAAEEAIADFSGMTIDSADATWSAPQGNGESRDGPIGQPGAVTTGRRREGVPGGTVGGGGAPVAPPGPRVVAMADLSRQPSPRGDLDAVLQRNYPPRAEQLGIEGRATVSYRIMPDGSVTRVRVRAGSESPTGHGFGQACQRTVAQSRWEPPTTRDGEAVATDASFLCEFTVGLN